MAPESDVCAHSKPVVSQAGSPRPLNWYPGSAQVMLVGGRQLVHLSTLYTLEWVTAAGQMIIAVVENTNVFMEVLKVQHRGKAWVMNGGVTCWGYATTLEEFNQNSHYKHGSYYENKYLLIHSDIFNGLEKVNQLLWSSQETLHVLHRGPPLICFHMCQLPSSPCLWSLMLEERANHSTWSIDFIKYSRTIYCQCGTMCTGLQTHPHPSNWSQQLNTDCPF